MTSSETAVVVAPAPELHPPTLFAPTAKAAERMLDFFTWQINSDNTRRAYRNATKRFALWCDRNAIGELAGVKPFHIASFVKELQGELAPLSVKQYLAALRMLFGWLVTGHIIDVNTAHAVRRSKHVVKKGKVPMLGADEARELLDGIKITKTVKRAGVSTEIPDIVGLRERAS